MPTKVGCGLLQITYSHASLIRDIGRFFNVPLNEVSIVADSEDEEVLDKFFSK